jgi:hypothetical protein
MPKKGERQTLMFSATFPDEVQATAREFLQVSFRTLSYSLSNLASLVSGRNLFVLLPVLWTRNIWVRIRISGSGDQKPVFRIRDQVPF